MAGGIRKAALLEHFAPDERAQRFLARLRSWSDDALLRGVAAELEGEGIAVVESTLFLASHPDAGGVADRRASPTRRSGATCATASPSPRASARWDIGQTRRREVAAWCSPSRRSKAPTRRSGAAARLAHGDVVVVKVSKPGQDLRFDVPAVGPATVAVCREAGVAVLALEAGKTLLLDREALLRGRATPASAIVGVRADAQ